MGRGLLRVAALLATSAGLLALPAAVVMGAEYVTRPAAGTPVAFSSNPLGSFPTGADEYGVDRRGDGDPVHGRRASGRTGIHGVRRGPDAVAPRGGER